MYYGNVPLKLDNHKLFSFANAFCVEYYSIIILDLNKLFWGGIVLLEK